MDHHTGPLAETMADVARLLQHTDSVQATWDEITRLAVELLDGVDHAAITIVKSGKPSTPAASDDLPRRVDQLQYRTGQGPCLDAIREHETFRTADLAAESTRWPAFGPRVAHEIGIHSMLSYRLFVEDDTLGALNLYSRRVAAFDDDALVAAGAVFAAHASLALSNAKEHEQVEHLQRALDSNRVIGTACGILMAQHRITADEAFDVLRTYSQNNNRKLRDVADEVVHTGEVPTPERRHRPV